MIDEKIIDKELQEKYRQLVEMDNLLPIKISDFYMKKIIEEIDTIGMGGPLYRSVIPIKDKIDLKTSVETRDYVEEDKHNPVENCDYIIQKYENRLVFIITDVCFAHCQYCFRTYNLSKFQQSNLKETIKNKISVLKMYLQSHSNISEVIFSGGDPLSIGYENMKFALDELQQWDIRIHTRAIVYEPSIFTEKMIDLLNKHNVRLVFHINHPYEIDEVVEEKINEIRRAGIRMYSQFPLLRGINDNSKVLIKLLIKMDELNIRPLSIFIPDPISYGAVNRISASRIEKIMDEVNWNTPSWVNSARFVMDTTIGKVRRENIVKREGKCITFSRDGKTVEYYDLDDGIDVPSPIDKLLWKN
ncbi:MAG: radical SAM protein [Bacilli bacterium]|nr:radical SAM protein [Bacilli bacterium]MBP3635526.1 radical SAM protein [Bacilli bacterium]